MKVYAMIPARSGSKGVPHKNIAKVGGYPLLAHAIEFGKKIAVDRVFLSTDSEDYAAIGKKYGAECPMLRNAEASSGTAREEDIIADFVDHWRIAPPNIWVWLKPTSPFRSVVTVQRALKKLRDFPGVDSCRIVSEADARLQVIGENGFLKSLISEWPAELSKIPRTAVPQAYKPYNLEVFRHRVWASRFSNFMGDKIAFETAHKITGLDIDDYEDLELVRALVDARPEFLKPYLHLP